MPFANAKLSRESADGLCPSSDHGLSDVGHCSFPSAKSLVESFASDPTFTGRTEIWKFAIRQLTDHPLVGYGYDAFWGTSRLVNGGYDIETWAARAGHAHNAYLNITITTGFIGLAALIWWIGICPFSISTAHNDQATPPVWRSCIFRSGCS
ncbi:O-antigen ligase family protein [Ochrobactrum tritici]|uniref:O-antigen ligase family protein n=1 Tax=Brucella tritici TaxID=94626 RepID=A0A7X6FPD3_9HYPH|nr:O-antigen ligase family protein [Brucella tritici]